MAMVLPVPPEISESPRYFGVQEMFECEVRHRDGATVRVCSKRLAHSHAEGVTVPALGDVGWKIDMILLV
jgi:hypothetical protein